MQLATLLILIVVILFLAWVVTPIIIIWSVNILWGADTIVYGLYTHLAVMFLYSTLSALFYTAKDSK